MKNELGKKSLAYLHPHLLPEWDYKENNKNNIFPTCVTESSGQKAYWICPKGHKYKSEIRNRTRRKRLTGKYSKCPICANRQLLTGFNDLASCFPQLLEEWDYEENDKNGIKPDKILFGSSQIVQWKCKYGHTWKTKICNNMVKIKVG